MRKKPARPPLAQRLRDTARVADLTSEDLAEKLGVSPSTVRVWWTGRSEPSATTLVGYADAVGAPLEWLITGRQREEIQPFLEALAKAMGAVEVFPAGVASRFGENWGERWRLMSRDEQREIIMQILEAADERARDERAKKEEEG